MSLYSQIFVNWGRGAVLGAELTLLKINIMRFFRLTYFYIFILILWASFANAETISVPTDYETIQAAIDAASASDTIIVNDGTYNENIVIDKSLTLQAQNSLGATIDASSLEAAENDATIYVPTNVNNVSIMDLEIISHAGSAETGDGDSGIYIYYNNSYITVSGNTITASDGYGFVSGGNAAGADNEINVHHNIIKDCDWAAGIFISCHNYVANIYNNTIVSSLNGLLINKGAQANGICTTNLKNNIIYNSDLFAIRFNSPISNTTILNSDYNNYFANKYFIGQINPNSSKAVLYSYAEVGDISFDPKFRDEDNEDFRLKNDSRSIDAGHPDDEFSSEHATLHGGRINQGAYGNTSAGANTFSAADTIFVGCQGDDYENLGTEASKVATISEGIERVSASGTVNVAGNCTYTENIVVDKSISIVGADKNTTIVNGNLDTAITVKATDVGISNFTITTADDGLGKARGIWFKNNATDGLVSNVKFSDISAACLSVDHQSDDLTVQDTSFSGCGTYTATISSQTGLRAVVGEDSYKRGVLIVFYIDDNVSFVNEDDAIVTGSTNSLYAHVLDVQGSYVTVYTNHTDFTENYDSFCVSNFDVSSGVCSIAGSTDGAILERSSAYDNFAFNASNLGSTMELLSAYLNRYQMSISPYSYADIDYENILTYANSRYGFYTLELSGFNYLWFEGNDIAWMSGVYDLDLYLISFPSKDLEISLYALSSDIAGLGWSGDQPEDYFESTFNTVLGIGDTAVVCREPNALQSVTGEIGSDYIYKSLNSFTACTSATVISDYEGTSERTISKIDSQGNYLEFYPNAAVNIRNSNRVRILRSSFDSLKGTFVAVNSTGNEVVEGVVTLTCGEQGDDIGETYLWDSGFTFKDVAIDLAACEDEFVIAERADDDVEVEVQYTAELEIVDEDGTIIADEVIAILDSSGAEVTTCITDSAGICEVDYLTYQLLTAAGVSEFTYKVLYEGQSADFSIDTPGKFMSLTIPGLVGRSDAVSVEDSGLVGRSDAVSESIVAMGGEDLTEEQTGAQSPQKSGGCSLGASNKYTNIIPLILLFILSLLVLRKRASSIK